MSVPARLLLALLGFYKRVISPFMPRHCRFEPTCSTYAVEAIRTYGAVAGARLAIRRITRCHPWNPGGIDRVPPRPAGGVGN